MKNKKGFTLIELLAVVLILSILLIIAIPAVMKYMKQGTKSYYRSLENEIKVSGMDYMETYRSLLPKQVGHVTVVELDELMANKYIDEVKDEKGNLCEGQVAIEKIKADNYKYHSCLKCGTYYESEKSECDYSELDNVYADSDKYRVVAEPSEYTVNQLEEFVSPLAKVYYNDKLIKTDLEGKPKRLDTSRIGKYEIVYYYHGQVAKVTVNVVDKTGPSKTKVVLRYNNKDGKNYKGNWYNGNIYAEYKSTDYTEKGIAGSGVAYYEVSEDGETFTKLTGKHETIKTEGNNLRYVRAVDNQGNKSIPTSYRVKIDKTAPTHCSWEGESIEWQPNLNLPEEQRVDKRIIVATCHDDVSGCSSETQTKTWIETESVKTKTLTYDMYDKAGNKTICTKKANIYIDKTKPVASAGNKSLGTEDYDFYNNVIATDEHSGLASIICNPESSLKTGAYPVTCVVTDKVGLSVEVTFMANHHYTATLCKKTNHITGEYQLLSCSSDANHSYCQFYSKCRGTFTHICEKDPCDLGGKPYSCNVDASYKYCPQGGKLRDGICYYGEGQDDVIGECK